MAWLLLMLRAFLGAAATDAAIGLLRASGSVALVGWVAPVMFAHSDIACWMSLVRRRRGIRAARQCIGLIKALMGSSLGARRTASPLDDSPDGGSVKERLRPLLRGVRLLLFIC
jgi:hypothetical protein